MKPQPPDNSDAPTPGPPYLLEAYNFVGYDQALFRWYLDAEFSRSVHVGQDLGHTIRLKSLLVIDETLPIFSKELYRGPSSGISSPKKMLTTGRFLGQGFAGGAQGYTPLEWFLPANCKQIVVLQNPSFEEASAIARFTSLPPEKVPKIQRHKKGEAHVWVAGWPAPVEVTWPFLDFGDYPSAAVVNAKLAPELEWIRQHNTYATYPDPASPPLDFVAIASQPCVAEGGKRGKQRTSPQLMAQHFALLKQFRDHGAKGLAACYDALPVSTTVGYRLRHDLEAMNVITITEVLTGNPAGGHPRKVATLTPQGIELLNAYEARQRNS